MIWRAGTDKLCDWFNRPWLDFVGRTIEQEIGFGWAEGVHPDDLSRCIGAYVAAFDARQPFRMEYRLRRHDGEYRWILDHGSPFYREGEFAGYFGSGVDVTAYRRAEESQKLLIDELNHRVKNVLAIVHGLADQSFKTSDPEEVRGFIGRLLALAAAHDVLTKESWTAASLEEILNEVVRPWCSPASRCRKNGPDVKLPPKLAVSLAMAIHELCVNAARYGAFSTPDGEVAIDWSIKSGQLDFLEICWREEGGPLVEQPDALGFGSRLLERILKSEVRGEVSVDYRREGLMCQIRAPIAAARLT